MLVVGLAAEEGDQHIDGEDDERGADETFADGIEMCGEREMQEDDGGAEEGDGKRVAKGVEQAELHAFAPVALDAGDVGDGGQVIVVEAVAYAEEETGEKGELERGRHARSKVRCAAMGCKRVSRQY